MRFTFSVSEMAFAIVWTGFFFVPGLASSPVGLTKTPNASATQSGSSFGSWFGSHTGPASASHVAPPSPHGGIESSDWQCGRSATQETTKTTAALARIVISVIEALVSYAPIFADRRREATSDDALRSARRRRAS